MEILGFLDEHGITYRRQDHPPVFTCEEGLRLVPSLPGVKTKNLFLRDRTGRRHFLIIVGYEKAVDLGALRAALGVRKLGFGSRERLQRYLGVDPGSVSLLGLINDTNGDVEVIIDQTLWAADALQCHPLVNTSTLVIPRDDIRRFLEITAHKVRVLDVPGREQQESGGGRAKEHYADR